MNELKRLQNTLGIAQSELQKVREQYAACNKYCAFLDSVTPPDFFQEQAERYEAEWQVRCCIIMTSLFASWSSRNSKHQYSSLFRTLSPPAERVKDLAERYAADWHVECLYRHVTWLSAAWGKKIQIITTLP